MNKPQEIDINSLKSHKYLPGAPAGNFFFFLLYKLKSNILILFLILNSSKKIHFYLKLKLNKIELKFSLFFANVWICSGHYQGIAVHTVLNLIAIKNYTN